MVVGIVAGTYSSIYVAAPLTEWIDKRLAKGESRSSALRDIQLELQKNDKYKHPYYWASFLPAGDNSPIEGVTK